MTNTWQDIRKLYEDHPMGNGDAVLHTDLVPQLELEALADNWDPAIRRNLAHVLTKFRAKEVLVAIARPGAELLPQDHALWADLREELLGSGITVHPVEALPAAA